MRIALVYDAIYPYVKGGAEKRLYDLGRELVKRGHEVHLYGMKFWKGSDTIIIDGLTLHGLCPAIPLYTKSGRRSIWEAFYFGWHCIKLIGEDFEVLDCQSFPYFSLISCKLVCLIKRKPLIATWIEGWGWDYWRSYLGYLGILGYWVERLAVFLPDRIISISLHTSEKLKRLGARQKIETIPVGVDLDLINKSTPSSKKSDVIFLGRLLNFKNVDILLSALKEVKAKYPSLRCFIIGDGPERENLESLVRRLGLTENVKFFGFVTDQTKVFALLKSSKIFVLPSSREGFGLCLIEANACGLPVITVDRLDNAAGELVVIKKNGFVVELTAEAISEKILHLLKNPKDLSEMKKHSIENAKRFEWSGIIDKIEQVYR